MGTMHSTLVNGRRGSWGDIRIVLVEAIRVGIVKVVLALVMVAAPEFSIHLWVVVVVVDNRM